MTQLSRTHGRIDTRDTVHATTASKRTLDSMCQVLKDTRGGYMVRKGSNDAVPVAVAVVSDWQGGL